MGSLVSPVIANIYIIYSVELALGPECTIPTPWWKGYVDDVISIVKMEQVDTLFDHFNSVDPDIKFTTPGNDGTIRFLHTKYSSSFNDITIPLCIQKTNPY